MFDALIGRPTPLDAIPLFSGLTQRQRQQVEALFVRRRFAPDQVIISQGSVGMGMYIVISGRAEAIRATQHGEPKVVSTFGPTDFFGELAVLSEGERTATVIAREETECMVLLRADFLNLMDDEPTLAATLARTLAGRFRQEIERQQHP